MAFDNELLEAAHAAWSMRSGLLTRRERFKRYTYGDQWGDIVTDNLGRAIREGDLVAETGRQPLTNNLIRRLVKTIVGRYRNMCADTKRYANIAAEVAALNNLAELDSRMLEEFLISGMAIQRVAAETRRGRHGVWVDNVDPRRFFSNAFTDPRGTDIEMCGMLHDMSMAEVLARFGHNDRRQMQRLRNIFASPAVPAFALSDSSDFFTAPAGRCRVVEIWTLEVLESVRRQHADISFAWKCRWLAPTGDCLDSRFSPWKHAGHPFAVKHYPMVDGEVHPFVEDVIDQQRYINRLIVLIDKMMGASAKGVLLFPEMQKPKGVSWQDIAERWSATDGIIPITGRTTVLPQQISGHGNDAGAHRLLELEMKLFEDVSGVSDALLGKSAGGNGGSALYESQITNSTIALADIFETFASFTAARDALIAGLS